jgi:hypothetical protein
VLRTAGASQLDIASAGGVFRNKTAGYIFVVAKDANQAGGDSTHAFVFFSRNSAGYARAALYGRYTGVQWAHLGRRTDTESFAAANAGAASGHNMVAAFCDWGSGFARIALNAGAYASTAYSSGAGSTGDTDSAEAILFRMGVASETPADSEIAEVVVVNAAMTDAEVSSLNAYLKAKWGTP